ncbi:Gfo/Idh/MocA family oxidoreductase [Stratiformator vulcanicus]|uniref:Inositol 2-dehydrogenase n=1 Tax=Stratiformator vulcanicus TaxID=2527980 RepID=A0A517R2F3_9PLAN|nr:Gfo/Idh/MocA family oxidoreductase [Stratiformator vulcanicus]QDT38065.1 Inositol 2-dehydrogenase [Stratiformator vulcanicus]
MADTPRIDSSRRDFMKAGTAAAIGTGVLSNFAGSAKAYSGGDDTIRVGLVGCGGRGTGAAKQALSTEGSVKLVAMGDIFEDHLQSKLGNLQAQFKSRPERVDVPEDRQFVGFDAFKKVIDSDIDLVILATPPGFRPGQFEYAVEKGKHIFMEKPVAVDAPGVRKVLAAVEEAKKKDLKVGVGLQRRHQPNYLEALDRYRNGDLGEVLFWRVYWNSAGVWDPRKSRSQCKNELEYQLRNWYYYTWICGDHIVEQHIHNIDVACWFKDQYPTVARGMGGRQFRTDPKYGQIFDHFAVQFEFDDDTHVFSECRHIPRVWNSVSEKAYGTKGMLDMADRRGRMMTDSERVRLTSDGDPYQIEHDDMQEAIRKGKSYNEGEYGAMSTMTAILGRMATYSGKDISMEKALASDKSLVPTEMTWESEPPVMPNDKGEYPVPMPGVYSPFI